MGVPMVNEPFGTTTISGQASHSLKLSFGLSACSISGVSGCTPFAAKNCRGAEVDGICVDCSGAGGFGVPRFDLADAGPARETASAAAANATSSFNLTVMDCPSRERQRCLVALERDCVHAAYAKRPNDSRWS
jgi:hypothetical protein